MLTNMRIYTITYIRKHEHISPTLAALGWCKVCELVARRDCIGVYRALRDPDGGGSSCLATTSSLGIQIILVP